MQPGGAISDAAQQKGNVKVLRGTRFLERGEGAGYPVMALIITGSTRRSSSSARMGWMAPC